MNIEVKDTQWLHLSLTTLMVVEKKLFDKTNSCAW